MSSQDVGSVEDPDGRSVELVPERWQHILEGHPELGPYSEAVLDAVRAPTKRLPGREAAEEWFYLRNAGPSRWLKVVVRYETPTSGRVVTAFARRSMP